MSDQQDKLKVHADVMAGLKNKLLDIRRVLPSDRPIVYLDYPLHDNVGDLLIHAGADAFLSANNYEVLGRYCIHDFWKRIEKKKPEICFKPSIADLDRVVARRDPILVLHGGGNLGDLFPEFQYSREMIVNRYPNSRIVIFPQSIHFRGSEARQRAAGIFGSHRNLFIFVRDIESTAFVQKECGLDVEMMPDTAHYLWGTLPQPKTFNPPPERILVQRRRDIEARDASSVTVQDFDWDNLLRPWDPLLIKIIRKGVLIDNPLRAAISNYAIWRLFRDGLIKRAVGAFDRFDRIETDRLHGVILGALMSRSVDYGDGSYGKLHRYVSRWFSASPLLRSTLGPSS